MSFSKFSNYAGTAKEVLEKIHEYVISLRQCTQNMLRDLDLEVAPGNGDKKSRGASGVAGNNVQHGFGVNLFSFVFSMKDGWLWASRPSCLSVFELKIMYYLHIYS